MSRVCTIVGDILTTDAEEVCTKGDPSMGDDPERFYSVPFEMYNVTIPLLVSEYRLNTLQLGHVEVTGSLMSFYTRRQLPKFYINASDIKAIEPDVQPTNEVNFVGTIILAHELTHDDAGRDVFTVKLRDMSPLGDASILYVAFRGAMARRWANLEKGMKICGKGYLHAYRSVYEIYANDVQLL